jgi:hypothetical protein
MFLSIYPVSSMEHSPSWKAYRRSVKQPFPAYYETRLSIMILTRTSLTQFSLSLSLSIYIYIYIYVLKMYHVIILLCLKLSSGLFVSGFPTKLCRIDASLNVPMSDMPTYLVLLVYSSYEAYHYASYCVLLFLPLLTSKYSPEHSVSNIASLQNIRLSIQTFSKNKLKWKHLEIRDTVNYHVFFIGILCK